MTITNANKLLNNMMNLQGIHVSCVSMFETNGRFMVICHTSTENDANRAKSDLLASKAFESAQIRPATTMMGKPYWAIEVIAA